MYRFVTGGSRPGWGWFGGCYFPAYVISDHGTADADNDYEIHFGNFAELSGVNKLGDISVDLLGPGLGTIGLAINNFYGNFFGTDSGSIDVSLSGAEVNAVPAPAGVWLLLTGLAGLATRRFVKRG